jgi:hypothetical protein
MNHLMLERGLNVKQSTLGERAGMGLFATTDFKKKETIDVFTGTLFLETLRILSQVKLYTTLC